MGKKLLISLGAATTVALAAVLAALLFVDPQQLVSSKKDELLKLVSDKIGREVTAGEVTASVGRELTARVANIVVAGAPGRDPQLQVGAVDVRFSLLRALLSFGKVLHVERFTVSGLTVRAARDAQGAWDFQDVLDRLAAEPPASEAASTKGAGDALDGLRVASLQLTDGRIELDDKLLGRPLAVGALHIETSDVVPGAPLRVELKAVLEDGPRKSPVQVATTLAVLPKSLSFDPLPDMELKAALTDVDLGPWGGLAPGDVPAPVRGTVRADIQVQAKDEARVLAVDGTLALRGVVLRDAVSAIADAAERAAAPQGQPLDVDVGVALELDQQKPRHVVKSVSVQGTGLELTAHAEAAGTSLAALEKAEVKVEVADLNRLLSVLPPTLRALPEAVRIDGPLSARLSSDGVALNAQLSLDDARVRYLDVPEGAGAAAATAALFDKAAGRPLNLVLGGKRTAQALELDRFALVVDSAKVGGTLSVPVADGAPLVANIQSGPVELVSLQGLVPPFKDAVGRGQKVAGVVEVNLQASSTGGQQVADAAVELRSLDVSLASTAVKGSGAVRVKAKPVGDAVELISSADFDGLSVQKVGADGALVANKPSGLPLRLDVALRKTSDRADVSTLQLAIGKSTVKGSGVVTALGSDSPRLDVDLGQVSLGFDDLRAAVPGASKLPAGGRLTANVKLTGGTDTASLVVDARQLNLVFGASRMLGDVHVENLAEPVLDVKLGTIDLAFDDVRALSESAGDLPAGGRFRGSAQVSGDTERGATVKARAQIDSLVAAGSTLKGSIDMENLDKPTFTLNIHADTLDVDKLRESAGAGTETPAPKRARSTDDNPHGLSKSTRALLADVSGRGTVTAARAVVKGIPVQDFKGTLVMTRGVTRFEALDFALYGGIVSATGTELDLPAERTGYLLKFKAREVDLGAALADQTGLGKIFSGRVSPELDVRGRGLAPGDFALTAEGPAELKFKSLAISSLDLLGPLGDALNKTGKLPGAKLAVASKDGLALEGFTALTRFVGGKLRLDKPVETQSSAGKITWEGAAGLDAGLDLKATLQLTPAAIARMSNGKLKVKEPVPVPMKIEGTWSKPKVTGLDAAKIVANILKQMGGDAAKDLAADVAEDVAGGIMDAVGDVAGGSKGRNSEEKGAKKGSKKGGKKEKSAAEKAMDAAKGMLGG